MPNYRRLRVAGGTYFFTVVTAHRRTIFTSDHTVSILRGAVRECRQRFPFGIDAWVVLPDHIHAIWTLPGNDADFSKRWRFIKTRVTQAMGDRPLWQPRFWERWVRNDEEFEALVTYVHFNPVRHGLVAAVQDWPFSTFHHYVRAGIYPSSWAGPDKPQNLDLE